MESRGVVTGGALVFVSHRVAGVHRIPAAWLDGYVPSGFRPATPAEIRRWHEERGLEPPREEPVLAVDSEEGAAMGPTPA